MTITITREEAVDELIRAARACLDKVVALEPKIDNIIFLGAGRGLTWSESDNWSAERDALRTAISAFDTESSRP